MQRIRLPRICACIIATAMVFGAVACDPDGDSVNAPEPVATTIVLNAASGNQTGTVGRPLPQAISVRVRDGDGFPLANASVTWTATGENGSPATSMTTTDANGDATVVWTLGPVARTDTLVARISTGPAVTITAVAAPDVPSTLVIIAGNGQFVLAGFPAQPLIVRVTDALGNGVPGITISWAASGGTLNWAATATNALGLTEIVFTPAAPGDYTVSAELSPSKTVSFTVHGT